jgi:hypothetical protein
MTLIITAFCPNFDAKINMFGLLRVGRIGLLALMRSCLNASEDTHLRSGIKYPDSRIILPGGCSKKCEAVSLPSNPISLEVAFVRPYKFAVTAKHIVLVP